MTDGSDVTDETARPAFNRLAVVALVVAVVGVLLFWPVGILGAVLGLVAANQIKNTDERGAGLALGAMAVGLLLVPVSLILGALL